MALNYKWLYLSWEECPECGNDIEVFTKSEEFDFAYDDEMVRCVDPLCGRYVDTGQIIVDGEDNAYINWD